MLELVLEYRDEAQFVAGLLICLAALRWGAMPERCVALVWLLVFEGGDLAYLFLVKDSSDLAQLDIWHAAMDGTAAMLLLLIGLQANRMYTLWIAAFQLVAVTSHLVRELIASMTPISYALLSIGPSYFQLALLCGGVIFHIRRKRFWGDYRDWRMPKAAASSSV
ncbi:hypothetical protein [Altererythrobacter sp. GH1-8]|uniref:hypothetical protein n=1 Tax=Altererythrobacter sp. GH1-8 TaxID=3349333 RepID=UPI00374D104F